MISSTTCANSKVWLIELCAKPTTRTTSTARRAGGGDVLDRAKKARARFDVWRWKPQLRGLMRAPKLWNGLLFGLVSWLFIAVNLVLWLGPTARRINGLPPSWQRALP